MRGIFRHPPQPQPLQLRFIHLNRTLTGTAGIPSEEAFGADGTLNQTLTGTAGIASAEAFGADGTLNFTIVGTAGIASSETFGADGIIAGPISGTAGIASAEAFGANGSLVYPAPLVGTAGIASAEAFGADGSISSNVLSGTAGIASAEAFGADGTIGSLGGPLTGNTGITSAEAFGANGSVTGPITGVTGIPSEEAFGSGGIVAASISGTAGIPSEEAFSTNGQLIWNLSGPFGIPSAEQFGTTGTILLDAGTLTNFRTFLGGVDRTDYVRVSSINVDRQLNFSAAGSFDLWVESGGYVPAIGTPVVQFYWMGTYWKKYFAGTVDQWDETKPRETASEDGKDLYAVKTVDWAKSLSRRRLNKKYPAATYGTLTSILADLSSLFAAEGIHIVLQTTFSDTLPDIEFALTPYNEVLDKLCSFGDLNWQVDWDKNCFIYDRPSLVEFAPFDVTDSDANLRDILYRQSRGLYRNRQIIHSTVALPRQTNQIVKNYVVNTLLSPATGDPYYVIVGVNQLYDSEFIGRVVDIVDIKRNGVSIPFATAGNYTADYYWGQISAGNIDFSWNQWAHAAIAPIVGDVFTVTFTVDAGTTPPDFLYVENSAEIAIRKALEGGTGIYEDVLEVSNVTDTTTLLSIAQAMLDRFSTMGKELNYQTDSPVLETGQSQVVNLPKYNLPTQSLLIEQINSHEEEKTVFRHNVKLSNLVQQRDALTAFKRLIARLRKADRQIQRIFTFQLAETMPGITNPGLTVGNSFGVPIVITDPNGFVCNSFTVRFKTAASGSAIHIRVKADGVTIFSGTGYVSYAAGSTATATYVTFAGTPLVLPTGTVLTIDVTQIGSIDPGQDGVAHLVGYV